VIQWSPSGNITAKLKRLAMETDNKSTSGAQLKDEENLEGEPFNYDDILKHLGQLGKFQLRAFLWLCLPAIFPGLITMSLTFTGGVPDYRYNTINQTSLGEKNINFCISNQMFRWRL
jgi:hypothetical protein